MEVPLTDLERYSRLLSGASWVEEFGDPDDPEQWAWMRELSPLHRLREGVEYPPVLLVTSQKDDRVHPWHARAMAHRLEELGGWVFYIPFVYAKATDVFFCGTPSFSCASKIAFTSPSPSGGSVGATEANSVFFMPPVSFGAKT